MDFDISFKTGADGGLSDDDRISEKSLRSSVLPTILSESNFSANRNVLIAVPTSGDSDVGLRGLEPVLPNWQLRVIDDIGFVSAHRTWLKSSILPRQVP